MKVQRIWYITNSLLFWVNKCIFSVFSLQWIAYETALSSIFKKYIFKNIFSVQLAQILTWRCIFWYVFYLSLFSKLTLSLCYRAGSQGSCYTTGFVQNSKAQWSNSKIGACPGGPFKGGIWNNVTVNVRENDVSVYLDGTHVLSTKGHFPSK